MPTKKCTKCLRIKQFSAFSKNKCRVDGLQYTCKECDKHKSIRYYRTKLGLLARIYNNQISHSKVRGDIPPNYTLDEFRIWANSHNEFHNLYDKWVSSNYDKMLAPSPDRKDDYKPYTLDNLQLTTWLKNKIKGELDTLSGKNNKKGKPVIQMSMNGDLIAEHHSQAQASRATGIHQTAISMCCLGKLSQSNGYKWKFA